MEKYQEKLAEDVLASILTESGAGHRDYYGLRDGETVLGITESNLRNFLRQEKRWTGVAALSFEYMCSVAGLKIKEGYVLLNGRATKKKVYLATV